jgi:hypothetical protein
MSVTQEKREMDRDQQNISRDGYLLVEFRFVIVFIALLQIRDYK